MRPPLLPILSLCGLVLASNQPDFAICINDLRSGVFGWEVPGAVDSNGSPVANASDATGLAYHSCRRICGSGPEPFSWRTFSQQFATWFLPWLPLMSQLPYGAEEPLGNFLAVLLMVGSPALAAYSLALAVLGNRWMVKRFTRSALPHSFLAAQTLGNLQQVYLRLPQEEHVLPSLIVLQENIGWWQTLASGLDYPVPKWTMAAIMSVLYLLLADGFSWAATLGGYLTRLYVNTTGEGIGSLWLCMLPIVICYLQLAPKSDSDRISRAIEQANKRFYVVTNEGELKQGHPSIGLNIERVPRDATQEDEACSAPVFFYARFLAWIHFARIVTDGFDAASQRAVNQHMEEDVNVRGRLGIIDYYRFRDGHHSRHSYEIFSIFFTSGLLALFIQWGTTGAAILAMYLTPTRGMGCRSISSLLYGVLATVIWLLCVTSSVLSHSYVASKTRTKTVELIGGLSIALRHIAKFVAAINTVWLFLQSLLQFGNLYDTCFCNSSVFSLGKHAYAVLQITADDVNAVKVAWGGGLIMSSLTAILFVLALNLLRRRPQLQNPFGMADMRTP